MEHFVLFLGAGFSKALDFPLTKEFVDTFEEKVQREKKDMMTYISNAKSEITSNGFSYDVESLIEYLQGHSSPSHYMMKSGPFCSSVCKTQPISNLSPVPNSQELKNILEEHMIKKCYKEDEIVKKKLNLLYRRLFSKISKKNDWKKEEPDFEKDIFEIF